MAARFESKVQVFTIGTTATSPVDLWLTSANTIAFGAQTVVASFPSRGVWRKQVGDDPAFDVGTQLDAQEADVLTVSNDGGVIAAQFGSEVRVFGGPLGNPDGGATSFSGVRVFALAGVGSVLALAGTDGGVRVATATGTRQLSMPMPNKVRDLALDGEGRTLMVMLDDPFVVYQTTVWNRLADEWSPIGEVDMTNDATHVALSHDGQTLVFTTPNRNARDPVVLFTKVK